MLIRKIHAQTKNRFNIFGIKKVSKRENLKIHNSWNILFYFKLRNLVNDYIFNNFQERIQISKISEYIKQNLLVNKFQLKNLSIFLLFLADSDPKSANIKTMKESITFQSYYQEFIEKIQKK